MKTHKTPISKGLSYLALALPLLFGAPIIITVGFKALSKDGVLWILIIGIILAIIAMIITALGVKNITKSFFDNDK
jgi:hypothetical protein